jgi:tRNA(Ile)-lysidine synthase TilS/MesJ
MEMAMGSKQVQKVSAVLLSGGWESALCLINAMAEGEVHAYFFDYGQPYAKQEYKAVSNLQKKFNFPLKIVKLNAIAQADGVFDRRNEYFIRYLVEQGEKVIYFGSRCPYAFLDKYKDSNKQFANKIAEELGITILTPALWLFKFMVKSYVLDNGVTHADIFSSEGYKYE